MDRKRDSVESGEQSWGSVGQWLRGGVGCLGVLLIVCGLFFAVTILGSVWSMVGDSATLGQLADSWRGAVGGEEPVLRFSDIVEVEPAGQVEEATGVVAAPAAGRRLEANLSGPIGLLFMLIFLVFLAWFTLGLISAGGKLVMMVFPDKEKVEVDEEDSTDREAPKQKISVQA